MMYQRKEEPGVRVAAALDHYDSNAESKECRAGWILFSVMKHLPKTKNKQTKLTSSSTLTPSQVMV